MLLEGENTHYERSLGGSRTTRTGLGSTGGGILAGPDVVLNRLTFCGPSNATYAPSLRPKIKI